MDLEAFRGVKRLSESQFAVLADFMDPELYSSGSQEELQEALQVSTWLSSLAKLFPANFSDSDLHAHHLNVQEEPVNQDTEASEGSMLPAQPVAAPTAAALRAGRQKIQSPQRCW